MENLITQIQSNIPDYVLSVSDILNTNGYQAYLVGGAVRNMLLGKKPKDFDIATNALPEEIARIFPRTVSINAKFGTVLVIMESSEGERFDVEVTTFRKEENYFGGRWPAKVEFTTDLRGDLSRRDFTINALAIDLKYLYDITANLEEIIIDYYSGIQDLESKVIRAVGNPIDRFSEDGLRGYRACRFASVYGFTIEKNTFSAIKDTLHVAKMVSIERIRDEFIKLIYQSAKPSYGIELLRNSGLLEIFLPELLLMKGITQPQFHADDLYVHSLKALDLAEDSVKIAALLHDIGKINTRTEDEKGVHFYGHDVEGAKLVEKILTRLRFSKSEVIRNRDLVRWHMFYYPSADWRKEFTDDANSTDSSNSAGWTDGAVRRFVKKVGENHLDDLFKLRIADATSNPKSDFDTAEIDLFSNRISKVRAEDMALKVKDLRISGNDLIELGLEAGPKMREILNKLLDLVIEDPGMNSKELLISAAKDIINNLDRI